MDMLTSPSIDNLFAQLGLDNSSKGIDKFVESHALPQDVYVNNAPYWNDGQRHFLQDALRQDSEWSEAVDQLNVMLHE